MNSLNSVTLQGNLTDDPKIVGKEDNKVARFTIAINRGFGDKRTTTFVDCVAFGQQVPVIAQHLKKGKQVIIAGELQQSRWETKEGEKRSRIEVRLHNYGGFYFVGNAPHAAGQEQAAEAEPEPSQEAPSTENRLF